MALRNGEASRRPFCKSPSPPDTTPISQLRTLLSRASSKTKAKSKPLTLGLASPGYKAQAQVSEGHRWPGSPRFGRSPRPEAGPNSGSLKHRGCDFITVTGLTTPLTGHCLSWGVGTPALCLGLTAWREAHHLQLAHLTRVDGDGSLSSAWILSVCQLWGDAAEST